MKRFAKTLILAIILLSIPLKQWGQQPYRQYADDGILLNFHEIDNVDFRVFLLYNLSQDNRFVLTANEEPGQFSISSSEENGVANFSEAFEAFYQNICADFGLLSKTDISILFPGWKDCISPIHFVSMMTDIALRNGRPSNNHCVDSDPFCTSDVITFAAATSSQTADQLEGTTLQDGCIGSSYNPSWFHMRIQTAGQFIIHAEGHDPNNSSTNRDIDFCIWGPYTDPTSPCVAQLTTNKIIDCCYSASYSEDIYLGYQPSAHQHGGSGHGTVYHHMPEVGEYYILMITNYSQQPCTISFTKTANSGPGETDCGILPGVVTNDGPYCVGETIHLSVNAQDGASYNWTGPNGFTSTQQNPSRPNCTLNMAGTYTCTTTVGSQSTTASTEVVIYPQPIANFNFTTVCVGTPTQFTSTSTTNPSGQQIQNYNWNFGDGQTSTQQNPSHQYASAGNYTVTLSVSCGHGLCSDSKTQSVTVYAAPVANAGPDQTIGYGSTAQLSGTGGTGTFNFHWEPANMVVNANAQNTQTVSLTQDQTYTLTVTNPQGGCSSTDEVTIHISGSAMTVTANASPNSLCLGESSQLQINAGGGTGNFTYSWTPTTGLSNPNIYNPIATPTQTTTYTCHVSDGQTSQDVSVTVTVHYAGSSEETHYICPGDTYEWNGQSYSDEGSYEYSTQTQYDCDSTITLHLHYYPTYDDPPINTAICYEESYNFFGTVYTGSPQDPYTQQTIQASHTLQTIHGCDSIVNLDLTIYPLNETMPDPRNICTGDTLTWYDGNKYYQDGDVAYFDSTDFHGCRQVYRLELTVGDFQTPPNYNPNIYVCVPYDENPHFHWDVANRDYDEDAIDEVVVEGPPGECDYLYTLNLRFHKEFYIEEAPVVTCDQYKWPVTGEIFTHETAGPHIVRTFPYYFGDKICDSTYVLDITINESSTEETYTYNGNLDNVPCDSIPFIWFGDTLYFKENTIESNPIVLEGLTPDSCEYKVKINIQNMKYTPQPVIDCPDLNVPNPHWPITATEFNVNRYTYQVTDIGKSDMSEWDIDQCEWKISKNSWRIIPNPSGNNPFECMIYAMDWVPDSICLSFKAVNSCTGSDGVIAEYWLHPSFYGVEEQEAYPASVSIIPNPNNGQMRLQFDNIQGDLNIKVYSLTGTLVDAFELKSIEIGETYDYSMKRLMNGIYFFTISDGKRSITKKVVVIH